jgi:Bacterial pre-peptidase C-terminal domain
MKARILVLLALLGATPAAAQHPAAKSWPEVVGQLRDARVVRPARSAKTVTKAARAPLGAARDETTSTVAESEPNHSPAEADSAALGVDATGVINPEHDVDTWYLDLTAGTFLSVDVDAMSIGSLLDPTIGLIAPDGHTTLAFNDDYDGFDSRISFHIRESGRYYVAIRAFGDGGQPDLTYVIHFATVACGPVGTEHEPNGTAATASPLGADSTGAGELCASDDNPAGDVDFWSFTAQAGTTVELEAAVLHPVDEFMGGDPFVALFASDGTTRLTFNDDGNSNGTNSRLQYSIVQTGTYYAAVSTIAEPAGNPFRYTLQVRTVAQGPGDPITVRAEGLDFPLGLAVGSTGDLFVGEVAGSRVVRISDQGVVTPFATGILVPLGLAFDAFDHLLVVSQDGAVYRVTPQGEATRFITDAGFPFWIAVAPDGRIWITDISDRSLRRYSPTGQFEQRFDGIGIGQFGPGPLTIGPAGEPYVSNGGEIWKLANGQFVRVLGDAPVIRTFAFDVAGNIYAPTPTTGRLMLFDATGSVVADPFAVGPDFPLSVAFGRDESGATLARLFATDFHSGTVIEMNPAGVAYRGLPVGYVTRPFTLDAAAASLLGADGLSADDRSLLDALGNHNGRYDVGDLQAYLRAVGALPGAAVPAAAARPGSDR